MQVRYLLVLINMVVVGGLAVLVYNGHAALNRSAATAQTIGDAALHSVDSARTGQTAFILADNALADVRSAATLADADDAALRFKTEYDHFGRAWSTLQDALPTAALRQAAAQTLSAATAWRDAAKAALPGSGTPTRTLVQPDRLEAQKTAISGSIDRLVGLLDSEIGRLRAATSQEIARQARSFTIIGGATILIVLLGMGYVSSLIDSGLKAVRRSAGRIAAGDLTTRAGTRRDEFGRLLDDLEKMRTDLRARTERTAADAQMRAAAQADAEARRDRIFALSAGFDRRSQASVSSLKQAAATFRTTSSAMSSIAARTSDQTGIVAAAAAEAGHSVQAVSACAGELSRSITDISRQVGQSSDITHRAVSEVRRTDATVRALAENARKISDVVKTINAIAGRTKLLALNATIEAARAGEAGRGFAVVATEVKDLAQQTASATETISAQIDAIQATTDEAVCAIREISTTIADVAAIATAIAGAIEEQGQATAEIARNIETTSARTGDVSLTINDVTHAAGDTDAAAKRILEAANDVFAQIEQISSDVGNFIGEVRAA